MKRLLVTGFEPFAGDKDNPSGTLVARMALDPELREIAFAVLPVTWSEGPAALRAHRAASGADACLMFGLASRAVGLRLERHAYNLEGPGIVDNAGVPGRGTALVPGTDPSVTTTVDTDALAAALVAESVPVELSDDPGRFLCNAVYHAALTDLAGRWTGRALFVHVPATTRIGGSYSEEEVERWMRAAVAAFGRFTGSRTGT